MNAARRFGINRVGSENRPGLGRGHVIHQGGNSGYQAINLAYLWGARAVVLLGLDCGFDPRGAVHWHGAHAAPLTNPNEATFATWRVNFNRLAADLRADGVPVYNCSRQTTLDCFERMPLDVAERKLREP